MIGLDELNAASVDAFAEKLDGIFEYAPWVAAKAAASRPFATVTDLHDALMQVVRDTGQSERIAFLRGHPALSAKALAPPDLTDHSRDEQAALGLVALAADAPLFTELADAYSLRFGIPFIICARRHTPRSVLRMVEQRLHASLEDEIETALQEVHFITRLRLVGRVTGPGVPRTTGHLSTHVLDTARGRAAHGVRIQLFRDGALLNDSVTDKDGRTPEALIEGEPLRIGAYELRFHVGAYFAGSGPALPPVATWYDVIPVCMAITEPEGHYHMPLMVAPFQYTTYRGS
jgi:2-oxo-4-hydroxy-4-carboxy-5-ureidoimidazoline decarboxylase